MVQSGLQVEFTFRYEETEVRERIILAFKNRVGPYGNLTIGSPEGIVAVLKRLASDKRKIRDTMNF